MITKSKDDCHKLDLIQFRIIYATCFLALFLFVASTHFLKLLLLKKSKKSIFSETKEQVEATVPFVFN